MQSGSITNFQRGVAGWYADLPPVADWESGARDIDWSTNVPVSRYYCGGENRSLREPDRIMFRARIEAGDTLTVGVDWYGLNMSSGFIPVGFLRAYYDRLICGEVFYARVYLHNGDEIWDFIEEF